MKGIMFVILVMVISGCEESVPNPHVQRCNGIGGVPVISVWDGYSLADCILPPAGCDE